MRVMQYGWITQGAAIGYDRTLVKNNILKKHYLFQLPLKQIHCHKMAESLSLLSNFQKIFYDRIEELRVEYMKHTILSIMRV